MDFKSGVVAFALLTALTLPGHSLGDDSSSAPKELTPCQKMMAQCTDKWGECFPREAYNGDACCPEGSALKCSVDMTGREVMTKDPVFAKLINCQVAGHRNRELEECMPNASECKSPPWCSIFSVLIRKIQNEGFSF